jgi:hypothetical protein
LLVNYAFRKAGDIHHRLFCIQAQVAFVEEASANQAICFFIGACFYCKSAAWANETTTGGRMFTRKRKML